MNNRLGRGILFIMVGPGGVGKNTMMNRVIDRIPNLKQLATYTTRGPRAGETHGIQRMFVTEADFRDMLANGGFIEFEEVHPGKFYGTPRAVTEAAFAKGRDLIADIEVVGASKIKAIYPDNVVLVFVKPRQLSDLEDRMRQRGDNETQIAERMARAEREMVYEPDCDYVIVNHDLDVATEELYELIVKEQQRHSACLASTGQV
jgi:guanylate kinase